MIQYSFLNDKPTLFIISTPIGNLNDITLRALETLKEVDVIYAEDTRVSKKLLFHYKITKPLYSYHEHEKYDKAKEVIESMKNGLNVALISDAGTPLISDPGDALVSNVLTEGFNVVPVPGSSALLTALVVSNFDLTNFLFVGFLPRKESEIKEKILSFKELKYPIILYESPNRILKTIEYLLLILGNRKVMIAKELTKKHETFIWTSLEEVNSLDINYKGEFVIILDGNQNKEKYSLKDAIKLVKKYVSAGMPEKDAMKLVSKELKIPKNEIYFDLKVKK